MLIHDNRLAIFFPGLGYTNDKPLMYYGRKIAAANAYQEICIEYHNMPEKVKGNQEMLLKAGKMAYEQACEKLNDVDFGKYEEILLFGKSIGTAVATKFAAEHRLDARLILYTPVEATFAVEIKDAVAFIGEVDPWSDLQEVKILAEKRGVPLYVYPRCNHSLECGRPSKDMETLQKVMSLTEAFISRMGDFKIPDEPNSIDELISFAQNHLLGYSQVQLNSIKNGCSVEVTYYDSKDCKHYAIRFENYYANGRNVIQIGAKRGIQK